MRFRLVRPDGSELVGIVQAPSGEFVRSIGELRRLQMRAEIGALESPSPLLKPGCVRIWVNERNYHDVNIATAAIAEIAAA